MNLLNKIYRTLKTPRNLGLYLLHSTSIVWPDKIYLKLLYRLKTGENLNLQNPQTFNEKLQWLKLYNRKVDYTMMVDKFAVKEYVATKIGKEYIIPTIGVWDRFEDIDFKSLPDKFVLKTTHSGGSCGVVICKNKANFDKNKAKAKLKKSLSQCIYRRYREWPYKNVPRRIIAEILLEDGNEEDLKDYKLFCFDGKVKCAKVDFDRFSNHKANYYTQSWALLPYGELVCPPDPEHEIEKPESWDHMLEFAKKLSENIPFVRIDFYEVNGHPYFGEITFYPASGLGQWIPSETDCLIGKYLTLPRTGTNV